MVESKIVEFPRSGRWLKILIADDEFINRSVLRAILVREGYEVDEACNGRDVLARALEVPYGLIFLDVSMPQLGGYECAARIRSSPGPNRGTPIVAFTGYVSPEDKAIARRHGVTAHVAKPLDIETVRHVIEQHARFKR